jgi:DNA-binding IclR family transcriptional regulator
MAGNTIESGRSVTSKVTAILSTFAEGNDHTMAEIARLTGLPMSTTHRLMTELTSRRFLERLSNGQYRVGLALRMIGAVDASPPSITERGHCVLEDIAACVKSRVRLGVLQDLDVSYIEKAAGPLPPTSFSCGTIVPAHSTAMGLALLAFSPEDTVVRTIERGCHRHSLQTVAAPDRLRHTLAVIRLTRVAVIRSEVESGTQSVAMPVFGPGGKPVAAFELALRNVEQDIAPAVAILTVACRSLSRELSSETQNVDSTNTTSIKAIRTA